MSKQYSTIWLFVALISGLVAGVLVQGEALHTTYAQLSLEEREGLRSQLRHVPGESDRADRVFEHQSGSGLTVSERNQLREQLRRMSDIGGSVAANERYPDGIQSSESGRSVDFYKSTTRE